MPLLKSRTKKMSLQRVPLKLYKIKTMPLYIYIYIHTYIVNLFGAPWCPGTNVEIKYIPNSNEYETFSIT